MSFAHALIPLFFALYVVGLYGMLYDVISLIFCLNFIYLYQIHICLYSYSISKFYRTFFLPELLILVSYHYHNFFIYIYGLLLKCPRILIGYT